MAFQSGAFLLFLAVTTAVCLTAARRNRQAGRMLLTLACLVFCLLGGGWQTLLVLAAGTAVTGAALRHLRDGARRRVLALGCLWHVAVLALFKYAGFFTAGAFSISWAPVGLSFFTFQQLWLLKEAYTQQYFPGGEDALLLHAFFFPTLTSGPILRPGAFFPQLEGESFLRPGWDDAAAGLYAITLGMGKKLLLADSFGIIVNNGYARIGELSAPAAWLVILGYSLQLYFDFSGYCDIATGAARLLGLRLPENFNLPYRSLSVGEFWKRWHMTLTAFLRECVYIPLGGSRRGTVRTCVNILLVFLLSGLWHGAGWTFLIWGGLHGLAQIAERLWGGDRDHLPKALRWGLAFLFVNLAWVFFRAPDCSSALELLRAAAGGGLGTPQSWLLEGLLTSETNAVRTLLPALTPWLDSLRLVLLYGFGMAAALVPAGNTVRRMDCFRPGFWNGCGLCLLLAWCVLSFQGVDAFIYSNF